MIFESVEECRMQNAEAKKRGETEHSGEKEISSENTCLSQLTWQQYVVP